MPLIKLEIPIEAPDDQKELLLKKASKIVSKNTGKPEQYVMVTLSKADFAMAGELTQAAFIDVRGIGGITKDLCDLFNEELSIPPENVYVTFTDVPGENWGHNGSTFA